MKNSEVFLKAIAVILVAGCIGVALLKDSIADMKIEKQAPLILDKRTKTVRNDFEIIPKSIIEKCQNAVLTGQRKDIPFLCEGIEYNMETRNETVVFYNSNQFLEYDAVKGVCIKFVYECPIGKKVYTGKELMEKAESDVMEALVLKTDAKIVKIDIAEENEKTVTFRIVADLGEDVAILISYRLDTGSCIHFDGERAAELLK